MSLEKSPKWVQEQVRTGLDIDKKLDIKKAIDELSIEALITFFEKNATAKFSKEDPETPKNSAAHIIAYQKALNLLGISVGTDGIYGTKTRDALIKFQTEQKLAKPNGIPGEKTVEKLIEALKGKIPKPAEKPAVKVAEAVSVKETPEQKIDTFLRREGYDRDESGNYVNPDKDLTITIRDKDVDYNRTFGRRLRMGELNITERRILAEVSEILKSK
ncbi:peptidoglycan-binding protein [Candidatus Gracilibacteria bacterium]|nr:peptidoglycan-binding protein [Candidatus Gracilibacteria bacterium]